MQIIKKGLIWTTGAGVSLFLLAAPAFAQIQLCPSGTQFGNICILGTNPEQALANLVSLIIQIAFILAAIIAVLFIIYGGIRWILSGGDKAGVEAARNTIIAAVVGLIIVFLSFVVIAIIGRVFNIDLFNIQFPILTI